LKTYYRQKNIISVIHQNNSYRFTFNQQTCNLF